MKIIHTLPILAILIGSAPATVAASKCDVCKGKKTVEKWITCPRCYGSCKEPTDPRRPCKSCDRSFKRGKVRHKEQCPKCNPPKQIETGTAYGNTSRDRYLRHLDEIRREIYFDKFGNHSPTNNPVK